MAKTITLEQRALRKAEVIYLYGHDKSLANKVYSLIRDVGHPYIWGCNYGHGPQHHTSLQYVNKILSSKKYKSDIMLPKHRLWNHIASTEKIDFLYYVNKPTANEDGSYSQMVCFDIDDHGPTPLPQQVEILRSRISSVVEGIYFQSSTGGRGLNGYAHILSANIFDAYSLWDKLTGVFSNFMHDLDIELEIRGKPPTWKDGEIVDAGTLARLPRPQSQEQANEFVKAMGRGIQEGEILTKAGSLYPPSGEGTGEATGTGIHIPLQIVGAQVSICPPPQAKTKAPRYDILQQIRLEPNGAKRRNMFAWFYMKYLAPESTNLEHLIADCEDKYTYHLVNRTEGDKKRMKDWGKLIPYYLEHTTKSLWTYFDALESLNIITDTNIKDAIEQDREKYVRYSLFSRADLAGLLFAITTTTMKRTVSDENRRYCFGRQCGIDCMNNLLTEGYTVRKISNGTKFKAMMDLLESHKLIECLDRGYIQGGKYYGRSRKYGLGVNHPLREKFMDLLWEFPVLKQELVEA